MLVRPVTAPVGSRLAITVSMYAVSCTAPRLASTGPKLRTASRTGGVSASDAPPAESVHACRSWTPSCARLPITDPHARQTASAGRSRPRPKITSVAIIATFHAIGAA